MSFTAKYGDGSGIESDDWGNETAKALRDAGYKSRSRIPTSTRSRKIFCDNVAVMSWWMRFALLHTLLGGR